MVKSISGDNDAERWLTTVLLDEASCVRFIFALRIASVCVRARSSAFRRFCLFLLASVCWLSSRCRLRSAFRLRSALSSSVSLSGGGGGGFRLDFSGDLVLLLFDDFDFDFLRLRRISSL